MDQTPVECIGSHLYASKARWLSAVVRPSKPQGTRATVAPSINNVPTAIRLRKASEDELQTLKG